MPGASSQNNDNTQYRYYAFISYSRKDQVWGEWVQKKIENYRLPTALRSEHSQTGEEIPKFVRPIFRDTTDMVPQGGLALTLKQELMQSKYLIVICSPASAQPNAEGKHWVNAEVEEFQKMGRGNRIIPLIVEGSPESDDPAIQCYPPALRNADDKLLGISAHEGGKQSSKIRNILRRLGLDTASNDAILKVLAVLLGVQYDSLKRRHEVRVRKHALVTSFVTLLCMAALFWVYDAKYREKIYYYANYVERYGVPEGVFPIKDFVAKKRAEVYRFTYVGNKLKELAFVNGAGKLQKHNEFFSTRPSKALVMSYDGNGKPKNVQYYDSYGNKIAFLVWSQDRKAVDFRHAETKDNNSPLALSAGFEDVLSTISSEKNFESRIIRHFYEYDTQGFAKKLYFMASTWEGDYTSNSEGVFGYIFERNAHNVITKRTCMGPDGLPKASAKGVLSIIFRYNSQGSLDSFRSLNALGELIFENEYFAEAVLNYNEQGNVETIRFFGVDGKLIPEKTGIALLQQKYDAYGNVIEKAFFNDSDLPFKNMYAFERMKFDGLGNEIEVSYFDIENKPFLDKSGYASKRKKYDVQGRMIEESYFDIEGKPATLTLGYAKYTIDYNEYGSIAEIAYFDTVDTPILANRGYHRATRKYNEQKKLIEETYWDVDGKQKKNLSGYAKLTRKYDMYGKLIEEVFLGTQGELVLGELGAAKTRVTYDAFGNVVEMLFFDTDEKLALLPQKFAKVAFDYDEKHNRTKAAFFDVDGNPVMTSFGFSKVLFKFNEQGKVYRIMKYDVNGNRVR